MHPPWITFNFFLFLLVLVNKTSGDDKAQDEDENSSGSRMQREIKERERRLIPYMTYYVTQSLTNPNPGARQYVRFGIRRKPYYHGKKKVNKFHDCNLFFRNFFIPITSTQDNIFQFNAIPKIAANNLQTVNLQPFTEVFQKPVSRIQNPLYLTPGIQASHQGVRYKTKDDEILIPPQVYRLEPESVQPRIQTPVQSQQIQSETQPLQVIKINQVPVEQKLSEPKLIKIIPIITKLPSTDRSPKSFISRQPQQASTSTKLQTLVPNSYETNVQNYFKAPVAPIDEDPSQINKVYAAHVPQENPRLRIVGQSLKPEKNKYTIAKLFLSSTTPPPYVSEVNLNVNDARTPKVASNLDSVEINQLRHIEPSPENYAREPVINSTPNFSNEKYAAVTSSQHRIYYNKNANEEHKSHVNPHLYTITHSSGQVPRLRVPQEENIRFVATVTPLPVTNDLTHKNSLGNAPHIKQLDDDQKVKKLNVYNEASLDNILSILKETDNLPKNLTPENIDSGIKTLAFILERLQQQKDYQELHKPTSASSSSTSQPQGVIIKENHRSDHKKVHSFPQRSGTSTPGRPGIDYPTYSSIPHTNFDCSTQRYKGFFGDPDTNCQVWHYCDLNGGQASFLCPNGTIFSQVALTCDWWFNVKCASTSQLYVLNERLYKYILPFSPSFPEDYSGPIVDTYLAAKFKEMEIKSKNKALKSLTSTTSTTETPEATTEALIEEQIQTTDEYQTTDKEV